MASLALTDATQVPAGLVTTTEVVDLAAPNAQDTNVTKAAAEALSTPAAASSSTVETKSVVKVDKVAPPPSLLNQILATIDAATVLQKGFVVNDQQIAPALQSLDSIRQNVIQQAVEKLPKKFAQSGEALQLDANIKNLKKLAEEFKATFEGYNKEIAKPESNKEELKAALQREFDSAIANYKSLADSSKDLLPKVIAQWTTMRDAHAQATLPITAKESGYIKDETTAKTVKTDIVEAHQKIMKDNNDLLDTVKAYGQALGLYLELSAMAIAIVAPSLIVKEAVAAAGYLSSIGHALGGMLRSTPKFNEHAPDPWQGAVRPEFK